MYHQFLLYIMEEITITQKLLYIVDKINKYPFKNILLFAIIYFFSRPISSFAIEHNQNENLKIKSMFLFLKQRSQIYHLTDRKAK